MIRKQTSKVKALCTWVLISQIASLQLIKDYYYPGNLQYKTFIFYGIEGMQFMSVGFWLSTEMKSGVICPFMNLTHSGVSATETFEFKTESTSTYGLYANGLRSFAFSGSTAEDSFVGSSVIRKPGTSWNYFAFNYFLLSPQTLVTYSLNSQIRFYFYTSNDYSLSSVTVNVGSVDSSKNCLVKFRINKLDIFYEVLNMLFGSYYDPMVVASRNHYPFVAIYKLNMSPFARNFVNLFYFKSGYLMATIISPQKSKTSLHFPLIDNQLYRYTFGISPIEIYYDPNVTLKSPVISSYTFIMNYRAFGTNYLAKYCREINACIVPDYKFVFYSRSNMLTPSKSFIKAMRTWSFKELVQELRYTLDGINQQIHKEDIVMPENFVDFDLSSGVNFVSVAVDDFVMKATPFSQICFYNPTQTCTINQAMISEFKEDDVHMTSSSSQPDSYYIYIFVGEISFHGGINLFYDPSSNIMWDIYWRDKVIFCGNSLDLKRIYFNSFDLIGLRSLSDIGIFNCFDQNSFCEFCRYGICLACMTGFELSNDGLCYIPVNQCDYYTKRCDNTYKPIDNIFKKWDNYIVNYYFSPGMCWCSSINILFRSKTNLSLPDENNPSNLRFFYFFANNLEMAHNGLVCGDFKPGENFDNERLFAISLFQRLRTVMNQYELHNEDIYIYAGYKSFSQFTFLGSLAIFEDFMCENEIIFELFKIGFNKYSCLKRCNDYYFYNMKTMTCEKCSDNCVLCVSVDVCMRCTYTPYYSLDENTRCVLKYDRYPTRKREFESMMASISNEQFQTILRAIGNIICSMGYVKIGDQCELCPNGCLLCQMNKSCVKCEANYKLTITGLCENSQSVINKSLSNGTSENACDLCFQSRANISPGCKTCHRVCECSLTTLNTESSYSFRCSNVVFSSSDLELRREQQNYSYEKASGDNVFKLISKSNSTFFSYALDLNLVQNTTYCYINAEKVYTVNQLKYIKNETNSDDNKSGQENAIFASNDLIILTLSIISGPLGNIMIGLLQFNKIFVYLSYRMPKEASSFSSLTSTYTPQKNREPDFEFRHSNNMSS
jgi:hypothetical protein